MYPSLYTILRIVVGSLKTVEGTLAGIISQLLFVWTLQCSGKKVTKRLVRTCIPFRDS